MKESTPAGDTTFKEAFCRQTRCAPEHFEKAVLRRCFPVMVRIPAGLWLWLRPGTFRRELALITRLGAAPLRAGSLVRTELEGYAYENQRDKRFRTETLGFRLSRRCFLAVLKRVAEREPFSGSPTKG